MSTAFYLALKETWRNRGRFLLFSLVIALITLLILFVAALGEGLGAGNREYIENIDAQLIVYQDTARLSIAGSRLGCETRNALRAVNGVEAVGGLGFASSTIPGAARDGDLDVSLIGVEPGQPGEPPVVIGQNLERRSANEALIDRMVAEVTGLRAGDRFSIRSPQGGEEKLYALRVLGVAESQMYGIRPSIFVPIVKWDEIRPKGAPSRGEEDPACNVAAVRLQDSAETDNVRQQLAAQVRNIEVVDRETAYRNTPGYTAQQQTLNTQNGFALLIGLLVIGGFFQIQTLQKVPQIGMLKAIGTPNTIIALASLIQIVVINVLGILIGGLVTFGLSLIFPPGIPLAFESSSVIRALGSILVIGPLGGLVSIRLSLRVEPLIALGLGG
ncbi:MAG: ABC transporter permease [Anaerolineae bacterium]|jgi:putative ABC transport system permease protein